MAQPDGESGHLGYADLDPNPCATAYMLNDNGNLTVLTFCFLICNMGQNNPHTILRNLGKFT